MSDTRATKHVIRNLYKPARMWESVGDGFSKDRHNFEREAWCWLMDNSNLSSATINNADWDEVWKEFHGDVA